MESRDPACSLPHAGADRGPSTSTRSCFTLRLKLGPLLAISPPFWGQPMVCCHYVSYFTNSPEIKAGCISEQRAKPLGLISSTRPPPHTH